jgi:hypothetical protein
VTQQPHDLKIESLLFTGPSQLATMSYPYKNAILSLSKLPVPKSLPRISFASTSPSKQSSPCPGNTFDSSTKTTPSSLPPHRLLNSPIPQRRPCRPVGSPLRRRCRRGRPSPTSLSRRIPYCSIRIRRGHPYHGTSRTTLRMRSPCRLNHNWCRIRAPSTNPPRTLHSRT